jgi:dihydrofolate reductase
MINQIVAIDDLRGMATDRGIPWQGKVPGDSAYFREKTRDGIVIMGFRTYEEFGSPLHGRTNLVVAREGTEVRDGFEPVTDLGTFLAAHAGDVVWIIGGAGLYNASIDLVDQIFITQLTGDFHCTTFFPEFRDRFSLVSTSGATVENGIPFEFQVWARDRGHPVVNGL